MNRGRCLTPKRLIRLATLFQEEIVDDDSHDAAGDASISHVERWVMPTAPIEEQEVHDVAVSHTVDAIADGTAQNERQASRHQASRDREGRKHGDRHEYTRLPTAPLGEKTEGSALVVA